MTDETVQPAPDQDRAESSTTSEGKAGPDVETLWESLSQVVDPELHMNIVDLGLVYEVKAEGGDVSVQMTLTTPGCPYGPYLLHEVDQAARQVSGVDDVHLEVVWDPPWGPDKMSEEAKLQLGFDL